MKPGILSQIEGAVAKHEFATVLILSSKLRNQGMIFGVCKEKCAFKLAAGCFQSVAVRFYYTCGN